MSMIQGLLMEFDHEAENTRKLMERVPEQSLDWQPHEKSFSLKRLAGHIAQTPGWGSTIFEQDYFDMASACVAVEACKRITLWGFTDRHTWIDGFFGPGFAPLPLDKAYERKPAYFGLRDGLMSGSGSNKATVASR